MTNMARILVFIIGCLRAVTAQKCYNLTIPIEIDTLRATFNLETPKTNIDVANFILNLTRPAFNFTASVLEEEKAKRSEYNIPATYCEPFGGPGEVIQVLTHGLGFDRDYWDVQPVKGKKYSYVEEALARGYSTFAYDRLGTGEATSSTGATDPINDIQAWAEVSALRELTILIRNGALSEITKRGSKQKHKFSKIVHVGHSYGSAITYALTKGDDSSISDGIALTGFSKGASYGVYFLHISAFVSANSMPATSRYPTGYLSSGTWTGLQQAFFGPGQFDTAMLTRAVQLSKPVTVGELLTDGGPWTGNSSFKNPALIITGDRDIPFCGGNCSSTTPNIVEATRNYWTDNSKVVTTLIPESGHGLNLEYNAQTVFADILNFFDSKIKDTK